ncbi:MAG: DEAD/DEAH box helicase [Pseudomonadota bacterium]
MFNELGLSSKVLTAIEQAGYTTPTPIQAAAIPHALERKDVLGLAQTGTGKTASFVLPMLSLLEKGRARARMPRTLILEPTRELAAQVAESFEKYGVNHKLTVALLIGGVSFEEQSRKVDRGADVVIATPGRLLDHIERGKLLLQQIEIFVVDEADRMLDMGFIPDIERICKLLPITRQTLFFSATMPQEIQSLVDRFLHQPARVEVSPPSSAAETVEQRFVKSGATPKDKRATLRKLLRAQDELTNAIIFCNRKRDIGTLFRSLERHGFSVGALHGDMDQRARMATLDAFKNNKITLLVASDVAARGLDIPKVSHVFNYDTPHNAEDYVHRIGRTGRAGRSGKAYTIASSEDGKLTAAIEAMLKRSVQWLEDDAPSAAPATDAKDGGERRSRGGRGRRKSSESAPAEETAKAPPSREEAVAAEPRETAEAPRRDDAGDGSGEGRRRRSRGRDQDRRPSNEPRVVFAETPYVPAFLLRPVPIPAKRTTSKTPELAD